MHTAVFSTTFCWFWVCKCVCVCMCVFVMPTLKFLFVQWTVFQYLSLLWALLSPSTVNEASGNGHGGVCQHTNPLKFHKSVCVSARERERERSWAHFSCFWISVPPKLEKKLSSSASAVLCKYMCLHVLSPLLTVTLLPNSTVYLFFYLTKQLQPCWQPSEAVVLY